MNPEMLAQLRELLAQIPVGLLKATYTQSADATQGLTYYDLEAEAKIFVPEITPLVASIPRVKGVGGTATNWRAVTALNSTLLPLGVAEGERGGVMAVSTKDFTAKYATIGLETSLTFEADLAGAGFTDMRALQVRNLLQAARIAEESCIVGANATVALGTCPTVSATSAQDGGGDEAMTGSGSCSVGDGLTRVHRGQNRPGGCRRGREGVGYM